MTEENTTDQPTQYCAISLQSLRINTTANFDMYMKRTGPDGEGR
jgi:hypothetical protein